MKEEKTYTCICGKTFDNGKSLQRHKATCKIWKQHKLQEEEISKQERESRRLPNGLFKCENPDCTNEYDGSYGNGKFCCKACAAHVRSLNSAKSAKKNGHKHAPKNFLPERAEFGRWKCDQCGQIFETRAKLYEHNRETHPIVKGSSWNKGLTKETDKRIAKISEKYCEGLKTGRIKLWCKGKHLSEKTCQKISHSMKIAHKERRAHNIGESRWNNEPSYPEKWFMTVIENEFEDKNYQREYPFHIFSLDFAWIDKKKCIEIDGDQHQRFNDYKARDQRKDTKLKEDGWQVLRLVWKDVFAEPKKWIQIAKDFIQ